MSELSVLLGIAEVVDLVEKPAGTIVHLRLLPGRFDDYAAVLRRSGNIA